MNRRERITLFTFIVLLVAVVLVGFPAGRSSTGSFDVLADSVTGTPTPADKTSGTPTPTGTLSGTPTPTGTLSGTPTPTGTLSGTPTPTGKVTDTPTPTPTMVPSVPHIFTSVSAYYTGPSVVVGDEIDYKFLQVFAMFSDGSSEEVPQDDYILSDTIVREQGANKFVVIYNGSTQSFYVFGKVLESIHVKNNKVFYGLDNSLDPEEIEVTAYYNDSSIEVVEHDYTVTPAEFTESGPQTVTISYRGKQDQFDVYVDTARPIKTLSVNYLGDDLVQDQIISKDDLRVMCVYDDGTYTTEKINNYELSQTFFTSVGENVLAVKFKNSTATCKVNVKAKQVTSITAKYTGEPIEIGRVFSRDDLHVYVNYNDKTEVETTEYNVYDMVVRYIGENVFRIYYGDYSTSVKIEGIEELPVDFTYVSEFSIRSGENRFKITTAIPRRLDPDAIDGKLVKKTKLTKAFRRLKSKNGWYCGFSFKFAEFEDEVNLPLTIRITLPDDMEPEFTELYYTPDLKNVVATMNKAEIDDHTLEVTIFKTGAYMIVYDPDAYAETDEEEEDEDE